MRIGLIGAGNMGCVHAAAYSSIEGVEIAGVTARSPERAEGLARRHGAPFFPNLDALLGNDSIEAVDVTVEFLDTARPSRSLRVASQETMRFNIARVDRENSAIRLTWPDDVSLRIFENLDRAFYGIDAVATP